MMNIRVVISFIFISISFSARGSEIEFTNFELKGELKSLHAETQNFEENTLNTKNSQESKNISPLIQEITSLLMGNHETIGKEQTKSISESHDMGGGVLNFSGFSWYRPMGNYSIYANREIAPELFTDKWIVHDTFTIFVSASTLLTNLKNKNMIAISDDTIGAFAGISFKRVYHYYHFADSYMKGLVSDYSKLLLPFTRFNREGIKALSSYEVLKKVDTFSFNAGGVVSAPIGNGMSVNAGVLINTAYNNETLLQKLGPDDVKREDEKFRISIDKTFNQSFRGELSLQLDFFKLIKLVLLSYDLEYTYAESHKSYLSFFKKDKELLETSSEHQEELQRLLKGKTEINHWKDNIIAMEERTKENLNSKFSYLLHGTIKKRATEQIKVVKDSIEKVFFKNYSESISYIQSLLSRMFSDVIQKIFDFKTTIKNKAELKKSFIMEYEHTKTNGIAENEAQLSIKLSQYFFVANTDKWYHKSMYKSALRYTHRLTSLPDELIDKIEQKELIGPISITSNIEIGKEALIYFNNLSEDFMLNASLDICKIKRSSFKRKAFFHRKKRAALFRERLSGPLLCGKKLVMKYLEYTKSYSSFGNIDLMKLKTFIGAYFSRAKSTQDIEKIFGQDNIFTHGAFYATQPNSQGFQTYFKSGHFRGLGVIDTFKRKGLTAPVNIE